MNTETEASSNASDNDNEVLFPIGALSSKTGVKTVTLRAWERRYGLLKPRRTPKGHRLYSMHDLERVNKVLVLLDQGIPVNRVRKILDNDAVAPGLMPLHPDSTARDEDPWRHYLQQFRRFIADLDARSLEHCFRELGSLYSLDLVAKKLIFPLYDELQERAGMFPSLGGEHAFFHEFLLAKLGASYLSNNKSLTRNHKSMLFLTGSGDVDHIRTLLLANIINVHDYQANLIGRPATIDALPLILQRVNTDALIVIGRAADLPKIDMLCRTTGVTMFVDAASKDTEVEDYSSFEWLDEDLTKASAQIDNCFSNVSKQKPLEPDT